MGKGDTSWFVHDRFGMFIHWGLYSMPGRHEWIRSREMISDENYQVYFDLFNPDLFRPAEWARAAREAGMKYFVITTKHHEGFCLWDSKYTDYKATNTPAGRDLLREVVDAFRAEGLRVGFYYSLIDWGREDAPRGRTGLGTGRPLDTVDKDAYYDFMKAQLTELLTNYGPVRAIWFDGHWDQDQNPDFDWRYDELYRLIHSLQPGCLVGNNHHLAPFEGEDIQIFERDLPGENTAGLSGQEVSDALPLETCQTMNGMWGYKITDLDYKSVGDLVRYLAGAAGRDANLLLNVGPQPDGNLPEQAVDRMKGIGEWLREFGQTIYGTRGGEMTPRDWGVMTRRDNIRYVHIMHLQDNSLFVPFTSGKVGKAVCLNDGRTLEFRQDKDGVLLKLGRIPTETDMIVELTLK